MSDGTDIHQYRYFISFFIKDLQDLSFCCGFTLEGCLICLISEQDVTYIDMVAFFLQPLSDYAFLDSDSCFGH